MQAKRTNKTIPAIYSKLSLQPQTKISQSKTRQSKTSQTKYAAINKPTVLKTFAIGAITSLVLGCSSVSTPDAGNASSATLNDGSFNQHHTAAYKTISSDGSRHEYQLANGLKVIIKEDHRAPVVMTQVWYNVGSTDEPNNKGGISHLLEHMMFKGTHKVSGSDFDRLVAKFGGSHNAFTSYDYTGYYEMFPSNYLGLALELEADRMTHLKFDSPAFTKAFDKERNVVMEERRQRTDDNPLARAYETFRSLALPDSPKGDSVIGPMQEIASITISDLETWYKKWYVPNNATVVIVGDVTPKAAMQQVAKYFGPLPSQPLPTRPSVNQKNMRGYQQAILKETVNVPTVMMAFNVPSLTSANTPSAPETDVYNLLMLQYALDGGYAARLEKNLVRDQGILASVMSYYNIYERGDGLFLIQATPREGVSLQQAQDAILSEIDAFKTQNIEPEEIDRARNNALKGFVFSQDSMAGQAQMIGSLQSRGIDDRHITTLADKLANVDSDDINNIARKYLVKDNLTVMYVEPKQ